MAATDGTKDSGRDPDRTVLVPLAAIEAAQRRLGPILPPTPTVALQGVDPIVHGRVVAKLELANLTHSFKIRGALNAILVLRDDLPKAGVVTASAGNHGLAVAKAGQILDVPVTVVLPQGATRTKVEGIHALGAATRFMPGDYGASEAEALRLAQTEGSYFLSPYDNPHVQAGAGTAGLELLSQAQHLARVVVPVGGGGLIAGIGSALAHRKPSVEVVAVQTDASAVLHTVYHGGNGANVPMRPSIADGLTGKVDHTASTIPILRLVARRFLLVPEGRLGPAVARVAKEERLIIEGATAAAAAALYDGQLGPPPPGDTALLFTGSNIDFERWWSLVGER